MGQIIFWQLLLLLAIAFLILALRDDRSYWRRLANELEARQPVFSAETVRGTEAEFIRDRLPQNWRKGLVAIVTFALLGALLWRWLA